MFAYLRSIPIAALILTALTAQAATVSGTVTNRTSGDPIAGARVIIGTFTGTGKADTTLTDA